MFRYLRERVSRRDKTQSIVDEHLRHYKLDLADQMRIVERDAFERIGRLMLGKS